MLGHIAACWAAVAVAGCAYISGPCSLEAGEVRSAICEAGGTMIVIPAPQGTLVPILRPDPQPRADRGV